MSDVSKYIPDEMAKNMPKNDSKVTEQEVFHTTEEMYVELENKDSDSDYVYHNSVFLTVHRNEEKKVMSVRIEGCYNPAEWKDISKLINALK